MTADPGKALLIERVVNGWIVRPYPTPDWAKERFEIHVFGDVEDLQAQLPDLLGVASKNTVLAANIKQGDGPEEFNVDWVKPCPFCGALAKKTETGAKIEHNPYCYFFRIEQVSPVLTFSREWQDLWNTRTP